MKRQGRKYVIRMLSIQKISRNLGRLLFIRCYYYARPLGGI